MAENWYSTMLGVQNKLEEIKSSNLITPNVTLNSVLSERVAQLEELRKVVYQKELDFFSSFSTLRGLQPKAALETLQMYVGIWNASGARHMVSDQSIKTVLEILTSSEYRRLGIKEFEEIANEFMEEYGIEVFKDAVTENFEATLITQLNQVLEASGQQKLSIYRKGKVDGQKVPHVYFTVTNKDGQYSLKMASNLDSATKSKLKKAFQLLIEEKAKDDARRFSGRFSEARKNALMVQSIILKPIKNTEVRRCLQNELSLDRIEQYNFARDFNVIKGFLGEVYWSAFFNYIGANTQPTGDIKDKATGQSIGIDLLVGAYGFQVKNFNIKTDGSISFGTRGGLKDAGTFITERAGINGDEALGELLLNLYGSYAYNVDVSDGEFAQTRQELRNFLMEDASKIFSHYIDRIIRLDAEQTMPIEFFDGYYGTGEHKLLFNAFFLIGDKIVPSSAILDEILIGLKNSQPQNIKFLITGLERKEGAPQFPTEVNWVAKKMANYARLSYDIHFSVKNIIENAYQKAIN